MNEAQREVLSGLINEYGRTHAAWRNSDRPFDDQHLLTLERTMNEKKRAIMDWVQALDTTEPDRQHMAYKYIEAWGIIIGSFVGYVRQQQRKALKDVAPLAATSFSTSGSNEWTKESDIRFKETRELLGRLVRSPSPTDFHYVRAYGLVHNFPEAEIKEMQKRAAHDRPSLYAVWQCLGGWSLMDDMSEELAEKIEEMQTKIAEDFS